MKKSYTILSIIFLVACSSVKMLGDAPSAASLRNAYSKHPSKWPAAQVEKGVEYKELAALPALELDTKDPITAAKMALGKKLFFDPRLSESGKISCAGCHKPELYFTDGKTRSIGHEDTENKRNSQGLLNLWTDKTFFWDGRSHSLEDQAFFPINNESEMHSDMGDVMRKLRKVAAYKESFQSIYNAEPNPDDLADAIANFERSLRSNTSAFDRFISGNEQALTDEALAGLHLFRTKAGCINCHGGPFFKDGNFHNLGLQQDREDIGRMWVTKAAEDSGKFKTPGLRDVVHTGPWLHDGSAKDLELLVKKIASGGDHPTGKANKSNLINNRNLTEKETAQLISFLHAISAEAPDFAQPELP